MRALILLLALSAVGRAESLQAVEFPYYLYPRSLWARELVWLKTLGVRTVAFSIPWNWHQPGGGPPDFTGKTSPRRDLVSLVRLLRRLELQAWVRPLPPVKNFAAGGYPAAAMQDRRASRQWLKELDRVLATQTANHGGPVAWCEGAPGFLELPGPPQPVTLLSATGAGALARSRRALAAGHGSLLWEDVEDSLYPGGWEPPGSSAIRRGAVSLSGEERPTAAALRRDAALLRNWAPLVNRMRPHGKPAVKPASGKFPSGVSAAELVSAQASAVSVINTGDAVYRGDLQVWDPVTRRALTLPGAEVPPRESLWLPVSVSLAGGGLCRDCAGLAGVERIVYATAELQAVEFENGILAMEFAAPVKGEVVLQLSRKPSGPFLAAGHPADYDFDEKSLRARLPVPQGQGPAHRVRIGLAIEAPESSAFFADARRLIVGQRNLVSTSYSSAQLAARSRLRLPEGFTAKPVPKSPNEIDYEIDVPADALHGDWANLAIEADGVLLGRARVQLFRPASIRLAQAIRLHYGREEYLAVDPPVVSIDPKAGRNLDLLVLNNSPQIQTYVLEPKGDGFQFFPPKSDLAIGAQMERTLGLRIFAEDGRAGLNDWTLRVAGGAATEMPMRLVVIPRGQTVAWSADLDGDGSPEWVLENQHARAVFSSQDGGRWMEFVWKDSDLNLLPENGAFGGAGRAEVRPSGDALEFTTAAGRRTVRLSGTALTVEQNTPLPTETLESGKTNEVTFQVRRESATRAVYSLAK